MRKELTVKERIIELSRTLSPAEIAETIGTSIQYVNKVLRNAPTSDKKPLLTLENYAAAQRKGITKKNDLAAFFGINRRTILRFENRPEIKQHFARYMELRNCGYELNELLQRSTDVLETITPFESDSAVASTLRQVITMLSKCDILTN